MALMDYTKDFQGSGTRRSYISHQNEFQEHAKTAKQVMHLLKTSVCGTGSEKRTPSQMAMMCWGFSQPSQIRNGLRFLVNGSQFQGAIDVRKTDTEGRFSVDFFEIDLFSLKETRLMNLIDVPGVDVADTIDVAVERFGLSNVEWWGDKAIAASKVKIDSTCNQALEWNDSCEEDREAVVYQKFIDSPSANLSQMDNVYRMARKPWESLSATERTMLVNLNIDDALAAYKEVKSDEMWEAKQFELEMERQNAEVEHRRLIQEGIEKEKLWRETHSWLDAVTRQYPNTSSIACAENAIRDFISASNKSEFSDSCVVNPEDISATELYALEDYARNMMMASLSVLPDESMESVLASNRDRDHDGSRFTVTQVSRVREWQEEQVRSGNVICPAPRISAQESAPETSDETDDSSFGMHS